MFRPCFDCPPQDKYFVKAPSPTPHFFPNIFGAFSQWEYFILCGISIFAGEINLIFLPLKIWNWNPLYWEKRLHFFIFHKKIISNQTIKKGATYMKNQNNTPLYHIFLWSHKHILYEKRKYIRTTFHISPTSLLLKASYTILTYS